MTQDPIHAILGVCKMYLFVLPMSHSLHRHNLSDDLTNAPF